MASNRVAVVDYGMGNLRSVAQAVLHAASAVDHAEVSVTQDPQVVRDAHRVVLPGQGAMPDCMRELRESGLWEAVLEAAAKKPLFGVCVGMQMLLDHSAEGDTPGLGLIPGEVIKFDLAGRQQPDGSRYKVPQMGWNQVYPVQPHPIWAGVPEGSYFYFVHSYSAPSSAPIVRPKRTMVGDLLAQWRTTTFLRHNSILRKARRTAWPCTVTFYTGTPEP